MKARLIILLTTWISVSCSSDPASSSYAEHGYENNGTYTCPMHPQVKSDNPGTCPICGMDLVRSQDADPSSRDLMLSDSQIKLANIRTQRVTRTALPLQLPVTGWLSPDEQYSEVISSRAPGRIEKLFIKETGLAVDKGQPLYTLYSEELLTLQEEYLLAKEQVEQLGTEKRYKSFLQSAEKKLLLYGLLPHQISQLTTRASLRPSVTFLSPARGIVTEIKVSEGQYIGEGDVLYRTQNLAHLWVEAELFPGESEWIKTGDSITVRMSPALESTRKAKVIFISPEYRANSLIRVIRATLSNTDNRYKPGQQVQVFLDRSARQTLALPSDAVIRDQKGTHVYVLTARNTFRPKRVRTGIESLEQVEILEGLTEGDTVAVSGAYLLYSELILKKGTDPMQDHTH